MPEAPIGAPEAFEEHVGLMFDLMAVAFQADITRVFTFMMARDLHNGTYPQIGVDEPHHALSHHQNKADKIARFAKVNTYHVDLFSRFVEKLQETPDGDGSLLDHSMVLYGSGMGNANVHSHVAAAVPGGRHRQRRHQGRPPHQGARARPEREPAAQHRRQVRHRARQRGIQHGAGGAMKSECRVQMAEQDGRPELHSWPADCIAALALVALTVPAERGRHCGSCRRPERRRGGGAGADPAAGRRQRA